MEKKLKYITYQTFPAKTANSIQTISTLKHINRLGISTVLIYPLRNQDSSDNLDQIRRQYDFHDEIQLVGTIHPLPFKKFKILEKYWYLISHFLWSFFTVQKYYASQDELYLTRSEWVFYFLSKKNAKVVYECHQITKLKKTLVTAGLKSDNSKVIALTDDIKKELQPHNEAKVGVVSSGYDDDFFYNQSEKKNHASHYYTITRLEGKGEISTDKITEKVTASAWMDHEIFTNTDFISTGWNWFACQFDDNTELMVYQLKTKNNTFVTVSEGSYIDELGNKTPIYFNDQEITPLKFWKDPKTKIKYPINIVYKAAISNKRDKSVINDEKDNFNFLHKTIFEYKIRSSTILNISPFYIHKNIAETKLDPKGFPWDLWFLEAGFNHKRNQKFYIYGNAYRLIKDTELVKNISFYSLGVRYNLKVIELDFSLSNISNMYETALADEIDLKKSEDSIRFGFQINKAFN